MSDEVELINVSKLSIHGVIKMNISFLLKACLRLREEAWDGVLPLRISP